MSGWTQIYTVTSTIILTGFAKIAAGSDTGTLTTVASVGSVVVTEQCDGWSGTLADIVVTTAASADPPSDNPGVSKDWLWVAALGVFLTGTGTITAAPSGYGDFVTAGSGGTSSLNVATADRALTATSENPGTFTTAGTQNFPISATLAIAPLVVSTTLPIPQPLSRAALVRSYHY